MRPRLCQTCWVATLRKMSGKYSVAGLTIQSTMPLPELRLAAAEDTPDWTFERGSARARPPRSRWFHHWDSPQGRRWLSFARDDDAYVLRFARTATFRVASQTRRIVCEGGSLVPGRTIRHLFLNQVLPLALTQTATCVLHASAVLDGGGAIGFAGAAGSGKSTLSAALSQNGSTLLCDDALILERTAAGYAAVPMYGAVRLWPDSADALFGHTRSYPTVSHYTRKRLVSIAAPPLPSDAPPLRVICVLARKAERKQARDLTVRALSRRDALMQLTRFAFHLDVRDPIALRVGFERMSHLVENVPVVELAYPWRLATASDTARRVVDALAQFA
jgi:hypothetical protein